jgi:acetolactate synthase-1/2/3 large subunit
LTLPIVHIDAVPNTDQIYRADTELVGDIAAIVAAIAQSWRGEAKWAPAAVKRHRDKLHAAYYAGRVKGKLNPTDVIDAVREALPRDAVATTDVGSHKQLVGQGWTTYAPRGVLMSNGLSSMGYSLPAAIVAQMLERKRPVVCFIGDGGLAMVQGELRLAASLKLPLLVVVFCDGSLNRIEIKQAKRKYPSWGTLIEATDMVRLAESMGCEGAMASSAPALAKLLAGKRPADRPLVVGATIDPAQYTKQF